MTAQACAPASAFLRQAGLVAAVLALIAGIFGMHVMTATHAIHSPAAATATDGARHDPSRAGHTADRPSAPSSAPDMPGPRGEAGAPTVECTDSDHCTGRQSMSAACTPSAKTGSLAAPLPGTGIIARTTHTGTPGPINPRWSYHPGSPSPVELCISRT